NEACPCEHFGIHFGNRSIQPGQITDVHHGIFRAELVIVETAMRQLAVEGHLPAFKSGTNRTTRTSGLAFATAGGSLAVAAAFAAADALLAVNRTGSVCECMETHFLFPDFGAAARDEIRRAHV